MSITILGAGLSGAITALAFAHHNIQTTVIDSGNAPINDIRTTALTHKSKLFLKQISIWPELEKVAGPINDIYVADNKAAEIIHLPSDPADVVGYIVENAPFREILYNALKNNPYIELISNSPYSNIEAREDETIIYADNGSIIKKAELVIACDGRNSKARKQFFIPQVERDYNQIALTFIARHSKKHEGTAVEHFLPSGPFAILPLKDEYRSSVVWTVTTEQGSALLKISPKEFSYLVQQNFGDFLGEITIESQIAAFPLKAYLSKNYYHKHVVLVADTAHLLHPLAGQGLNQGIKDIELLSHLISKHGINQQVLAEYEARRTGDNKEMYYITDTINRLFSDDSILLHKARNLGFAAMDRVTPFKKMLIKYAMGYRNKN